MNKAQFRKKNKILSSKSGAMTPRFFVLVSLGALLLLTAFIVVVKTRLDDYSRQTLQYLIDGTEVKETPKAEIDDPNISNSEIKAIAQDFSETKVFGDTEAKVKIIYFSDYACSVCQRQDAALQKLLKKYPKDIYLVAKDYPNSNIESKTFQLALGGYCAYQQGNFWEYKNLVYRNIDKYDDGEELALYVAQQLVLKIGDFRSCLKDKDSIAEVQNDIRDGENIGAFIVPFIKVNNQELLGEITDGDLDRAVTAELSK